MHLQLLEHGDHVGRLAGVDQRAPMALKDQPVLVAVEVAVGQQVGGAVPGAVVEQQAAQHACSASTECGGTRRRATSSSRGAEVVSEQGTAGHGRSDKAQPLAAPVGRPGQPWGLGKSSGRK
jgi:hypothetical protein